MRGLLRILGRREVVVGLVLFNGAVAFLEALRPSSVALDWLAELAPFSLSRNSRLLLLFASIGLFSLGRGLARRKRMAWALVVSLLVTLPLLHIGHALDWHHLPAAFLAIGVLVWRRKDFVAQSDASSVRVALRWGGIFLAIVLAYGILEVKRCEESVSGRVDWVATVQATLELMFLQDTDIQIPMTAHAERVFFNLGFGGILVSVVGLLVLLRPVLMRSAADESTTARARETVAKWGRDPMDEFALLPDKRFFFSRESVVAYALWRNVAVALAGPIGPSEERRVAISGFIDFCRMQDWEPAFFQFPAEERGDFSACGVRSFKIAEDALVTLSEFNMQGGKFQNVRTGVNKGRKLGWQVRWCGGGHGAAGDQIEAQIHEISNAWLEAKRGGEMAFDLSQFSVAALRERETSYVLDGKGRALAFATWLPYAQGTGRCIDMMRHPPSERGVMDFLISESLMSFRDRGIVEASLGNAPLANVDVEAGEGALPDQAVRYFFENFNRIYGYKSLFEFKKKYCPQWRGRFLGYISAAALPLVIYGAVRVHLPEGIRKFLRS